MTDPTIPAQLCEDRTTHEPHQWLDSDKGNPKNHTWWCPGLSYAPGTYANPDEDEMLEVAAQIRDEFKERIGLRIQTMTDDLGRAIQQAKHLLQKVQQLDDDLVALKMELEDE